MRTKLICMRSFCVEGDWIWFIHAKYNALMKYNVTTKEMLFVESLLQENIESDCAFYRILYLMEKVILIPNRYTKILIYDVNTRTFNNINCCGKDIPVYGLFRSAIVYHNNVICIPSQYHSILSLNVCDCTYERLLDWIMLDSRYSDSAYIYDFSLIDNKLVLLVKPYNDIIVFSLDSNMYDVIKGNATACDYTTLATIGTNVYVRNIATHMIDVIDINTLNKVKEIDDIANNIYLLYSFEKEIMVEFFEANRIIVVNDDFKIFNEFSSDEYIKDGWPNHMLYTNDMKYIGKRIFFNNKSSELLIFDDTGKIGKKEKVTWDVKDDCNALDEIIINTLKGKNGIIENPCMDLCDFLRII